MLYRLKDICEEHKAIIVLLGDVVARRVNIQSIVELKEMLSDIPIHIVPAHEYDNRSQANASLSSEPMILWLLNSCPANASPRVPCKAPA